MQLLAFLAGLFLPLLGVGAGLVLATDSLMGGVVVAVTSAALASIAPPGGGMVIAGTTRVRFFRREWTFDRERSAREGLAGTFFLTAAVVVGFFLPMLGVAPAYALLADHLPVSEETTAILAVLLLLAIALPRHRAELPLSRWRRELEEGAPDDATLDIQVEAMARIARADGSVGHVGGIGTAGVGLHELLDAERILREAEGRGRPGASELRGPLLSHLVTREEAGGFPVYPGGLPREAFTARAREALATLEP